MHRLLTALFLILPATAFSQSVCHYLSNDQTYVSERDGENITFYNNGLVAINGSIDRRFAYDHEDCEIRLYYNGRQINTLVYGPSGNDPARDCDCLFDKRGIKYIHLVKKSNEPLPYVSSA